MYKMIVILVLIFSLQTVAFCEQSDAERAAERKRVHEELTRQNEAEVAEAYEKMEKEKAKESPVIQEQRRGLLEKTVQAMVGSAEIKGKVVDMDGNPIAGAKVLYDRSVFNPRGKFLSETKEGTVTADKNGDFEIKASGFTVSINRVQKEGFSYQWDLTKAALFDLSDELYSGPASEGIQQYDLKSTEPFIYYMRKHGQIDYLIVKGVGGIFDEKKNEPVRPLLLDTWIDEYGTERDVKKYSPSMPVTDPDRCLEISCVFSDDYSEFDIIFKAITEGSGVIITKDLLYEAPETGYQDEVVYHDTMVDQNNLNRIIGLSDKELYVYVQGPNKKFYTRIDMKLSTKPIDERKKYRVRLDGTAYTNPLGRRYLEYVGSTEEMFRKSLKSYRQGLEAEARKNREVFNVIEFKKMVDQRYAGRDMEALKADREVLSEKSRKEMEAQEEARLRAMGLWSDDPAERMRLQKEYDEQKRAEYQQMLKKVEQDSLRRAEEVKQRREANQKARAEKAAAEKAAQEQAK